MKLIWLQIKIEVYIDLSAKGILNPTLLGDYKVAEKKVEMVRF